MEKDYRLVFVGDMQVGLIGLKEIFEELRSRRDESESVLKEMLVDRTKKNNYIAPSLKQEYEKALFREFRKFLGEEVEEERRDFLEVLVLGTIFWLCFPKRESRQP